MKLNLGERVRIDIPVKSDPDFEFHGEHGVIIEIVEATCPSHSFSVEIDPTQRAGYKHPLVSDT